ncbi:unnamed protein product [Symbiodinium sp. CCMP2592]|nr:unnamed protein product [Symbiodinium sp. CCMP2592]
MPQIGVRLLLALSAAHHGSGWLFERGNVTGRPEESPRADGASSRWAQLRDWADERLPSGEDLRGLWAAWFEGPGGDPPGPRSWSWDSGLCMVLDTLVSCIGWALFGSAWPNVRTGCQRAFRLVMLMLLCLGAHYLWALCWPVISLVTFIVMCVVWTVRVSVRKIGTLVYWAQRAAGGVPEAAGADFIGPGTGRIPETADLRLFKSTAGGDKWALVRREGHVAVFKVGSENQTNRSPGLFVPVEADTLRGSPVLIDACKGVDKVHLCRHLVCTEEGQHFKEYAVARDFDPEKFHLKNAELEATRAGRTLWAWFWSSGIKAPRPPQKEFGSESETEDKPCGAVRVKWSDRDGDHSLAASLCKGSGTHFCALLAEDQFDEVGGVSLCAQHALEYERRRRPQRCFASGCNHVGIEDEEGLRRCRHHPASKRAAVRRKSPARSVAAADGDDPEEPELPPRGNPQPREIKRLLDEIRSEMGEVKRAREKSPGGTPKSSIQRNLARLGLLDSPVQDHPLPILEEFFNQYAEGRSAGVSEEEVRANLAMERGMSVKEITQALLKQAIDEKAKGQKGLSKFVSIWQRPSTRGSSPSSVTRGSSVLSWEVVDSPDRAGPVTPERAPQPLRIGNPSIFGVDDRKAGATEGPNSMESIAKAIQSQSAEIELVFILRACNQYQVTVGAGEQGQALANALLSAQVGASTKLRKAGFKQKVTPRLAIGLAGPYWGTAEKYSLAAADFVANTDAELDAYVLEVRAGKGGSDQRPPPPTRLEDWEGRVRRQNDVWALLYGAEWKPVRNHALELLLEWHQGEPHKWPLTVIMEVWEELHWRFFEELKEILRLLKKEAGRETMSLQDLKFHALLPNASGVAWLELPRTFDLRRPDGWFMSEVLPRIERRQERMLWRLTWEGGRGGKPASAHAGGDSRPEPASKPSLRGLWGPKLTVEEVNRAKDRAPLDKDGVLQLCWGALTHMGCSNASCQRSHSDLQGKFETLEPCLQMQLLRRGGLRRMRAETKESVTEKIKALRAAVAKDRASKVSDGRKSGQPADEGAPASTRAGGDAVRFAEVPEEFDVVDFTVAEEELREALKGPDAGWLECPPSGAKVLDAASGESAPQQAHDFVEQAKEMIQGPVLGHLKEASDDLFAWAASRVAKNPQASLEEVLGDMAIYGLGDLAAEASRILEARCEHRAGSAGGIIVTDVVWEPGQPGRGSAVVEGATWTIWDYKEEVFMSEEMASMLRQPEEGLEKRQCVTKAVAAGIMWRELARRPTVAEVDAKALELRLEQTRQALEAQATMGEPALKVAPIEAEIRVYTHDIVRASHDKDFRSLAVFPLQDLEDCKMVVIRADYKGDVVVETVTGPLWQANGWVLWTLIWRDVAVFLDRWQPYDTPALGFLFFWHSRHDQEPTAVGSVSCRLCKGRKAGDALGCIRAGAQPVLHPVPLRGSQLCLQEVFAGFGDMTRAWAAAGLHVLSPIEVYADPATKSGYRAECDVARPEVQKQLLYSAKDGAANVWWLAPPCTSFCDWGLENGGTRTFQVPTGGANHCPPTDVEVLGNMLSKVAAEIFLQVLRGDGFPVAESTARSGRYPKMWDLPWWKAILARPDVQFVEFPMCAFGLGPEGEDGFYHHRTRIVFRKNEAFARALSRRCPGVGAAHLHAGRYCPEFVRTVVSTLQQVLVLRGGRTWHIGEMVPLLGGLGSYAGWLEELDGDDDLFTCGDLPTAGVLCPGVWDETRAGSAEYRAPSAQARAKAEQYIELAHAGGPGEPEAWAKLCERGGELVKQAGSVRLAAESLWQVREESGLNHLRNVDDPYLDTVLHPDLLEYLRDVRRRGLAARFVGERQRCQAKIHPNGRRNLAQVYRQIWKDVCKLRVLVVPAALEELGPVISSPFDAVDKMLPDRSVAPDKRIVHDQRVINCGTDKEWHPPAIQPKHEQVARLVLRAKAHLPGTDIFMSKKDVAGAFRLLWVDPNDADLFAGDLPWVPEEMEGGKQGDDGMEMTVVYLVLRLFGIPRRVDSVGWAFESRILVDDNVLVEPWIGLRPWVAGEVYEAGVKMLLGEAAVNREKDLVEGPFRTFQTVWGLDMDTATEEVHLPERRILKGAHLLSDAAFEYGSKDITVRAVQRFRGITTGWTVIVRGLRNELKAADRFLGAEREGGAKVQPKLSSPGDAEEEDEAWELFEEVRWLCARPETWATKFGAGMRELLPVRERLALSGEWDAGTVFVSSDATKLKIAAIDWTNGVVMRMAAADAATWVQRCQGDDEVAIHVAEMLSFLSFACHVGPKWKAGTRVGRLLVRIANLLEMRYRFVLLPAWWRTYHNVHADLLTRCTDEEFADLVKERGWSVVDVQAALRQAVIDSERFGPCLLAWGDEDRQVLMQLKERRLCRAIPHALQPRWENLRFVELCGPTRRVTDFLEAIQAAGGMGRRCTLHGPIEEGEIALASLPPDRHGHAIGAIVKACVQGPAGLVVIEGPRGVKWTSGIHLLEAAGWNYEVAEFVTTEFGEVAARRRTCVTASPHRKVEGALCATTSRGVLGPPMSSAIRPTRCVPPVCWLKPERVIIDAGIPREPLLPFLKGHFWNEGKRFNLVSTGGPLRWPLRDGSGVQESVVWDPRGPPGVRVLEPAEVWACQGRTRETWDHLRGEGLEPEEILVEGARATGGHTAAALCLMTAYVMNDGTKAGSVRDLLDDENLNKLLGWLRKWKRGLFRFAVQIELYGAINFEPNLYPEAVWSWGEAMWLSDSSDDDGGECVWSSARAAGRRATRRGKAVEAVGEAQIRDDGFDTRPFDGGIGAMIDEWIEDNLCGYLAESMTKQYAGVYAKWKAWARRQGWPTEFLDKALATEGNENKLLGFLGYLGWLGASPATLKQAVFAIKDGHKRGGQGDPTDKMFRLWMLLGALDRKTPKSPRRLGVTPEMLKWIDQAFATNESSSAQEKFDAAMIKAAVLVAWFFMLRAKEYCESNGIDYAMILRGADLKFLDAITEEGLKGVTMQFRKTKTDQEAYGTCKTMYESGVKGVCVVTALEEYKRIAPQRFDCGSEALQPLFRWANGQVLKRTQMQDLLQRAAKGIGLPPERFRSHSLRIGGASALFQATGEIELVKRTGRWSSSAVQKYLHDGETALKAAASKMARVEQKIHYT